LVAGLAMRLRDDGGDGDDATTTTTEATQHDRRWRGLDHHRHAGGDAPPGRPARATPPGRPGRPLGDADLGCDAVSGQRTADGAQGAAQCDLATENPAYLYSFDDNDQRDAFIDGGGVIDCTFIFGSGITFDYVVADNVIIRPEDN
jgi:hypothetical protein